jgi:hypothetical protein
VSAALIEVARAALEGIVRTANCNHWLGMNESRRSYAMARDAQIALNRMQALTAAEAQPTERAWTLEECDRVMKTLRYVQGIAERGEGRLMRDDETLEAFVLGYVKRLEAQPTPCAKRISERITHYLAGGGLFNPEAANHDAVRDLLIDCRAALDTAETRPTDLYSHLAEALGCDPMDSHDTRIGRALTARLAMKANPAAPAPLTDRQLAQIWDEALDQLDTRNQLRFIARAIERAHGIGEGA